MNIEDDTYDEAFAFYSMVDAALVTRAFQYADMCHGRALFFNVIARWKRALRAHGILMYKEDKKVGFLNEDEARRFVSQSAQSMCFSYEDEARRFVSRAAQSMCFSNEDETGSFRLPAAITMGLIL